MLVIRVELWSARDGSQTEIARMRLYNDASGTVSNGNYVGETFIGRDADALDKKRVNRQSVVTNWPRQRLHVWNLVAQMLSNMGYGPSGPKGWE